MYLFGGRLGFFLQFRERLTKRYPEIYSGGTGEADQRSAAFGKKWGWYQTFDTYAKAERINIDEVQYVNINKILFRLAYESDKAKLMTPIKK